MLQFVKLQITGGLMFYSQRLFFLMLCLGSTLFSSEQGWISPATIDDTESQGISSVFTCYNSTTNQVFATWSDENNSQPPRPKGRGLKEPG